MSTFGVVTFLVSLSLASCQTGSTGSCATKTCPINTVCKEHMIFCFRPPCPPPKTTCEKPGTCPRDNGGIFGTCDVRCQNDESCPGILKCCGGCPKECKLPLQSGATSDKPGQCPRQNSFMFEPCRATCFSDNDCNGAMKCCGSCCKAPASTAPTIKSGNCPAMRPISFMGLCEVKCDHDGDCAGAQKCCGRCPRECTSPTVVPKPGNCPRFWFPPRQFCFLQHRCTKDNDCPENQKCCGSCPRVCSRPWGFATRG